MGLSNYKPDPMLKSIIFHKFYQNIILVLHFLLLLNSIFTKKNKGLPLKHFFSHYIYLLGNMLNALQNYSNFVCLHGMKI